MGLVGTIEKVSPHGSYVTVKLSDRIWIVGTYNNQFDWEPMPETDSGFESFITYIGLREAAEVRPASFLLRGKEMDFRSAKTILGYPLELKCRGLKPEVVHWLVENL